MFAGVTRGPPSPGRPPPRARAPCRTAPPRSRDEPSAGGEIDGRRPTVRARAGRVHVVDRREQVEQVAVRHRQHEDHRRRHPQRPQRRQQSRPRRREGEEHDERDRHRDPHHDEAGRLEPFGGEPDAVRRTTSPSGTTIVPGVIRFSVAGSTTIAGEDRHEQPHPGEEEPEREAARQRERDRSDVHRAEHRDRLQERGDDHQAEEGHDLDPRVESLQQAGTAGDVVGEHRAPDEVRDAAERLGHETALAPLPDASARAQPDLAVQQPVGREPGRRAGRRAHTRRALRRRPPRRRSSVSLAVRGAGAASRAGSPRGRRRR